MNLRQPLDRRTFLRASGVALALPMLESMTPRLAHAAAGGPRRMVNICNTLGLYKEAWFPKTTGAGYETTEYLSLLEKHRDNFTLFSGFSHEEQTGRQPHNSEITFLTAARRPGLDGFRNTISMDQVAANHLGYTTRFPSVVLGTAAPQSQSYTRSGAMVPAETSPANLFRQLFLQGTPEEVEREKQSLNDGGSILDRLKSQTSALRRRVSLADQVKLDSYFNAVRTAELDLAEVKAWQQKPKPVVSAEPPVDIPSRSDLIGSTAMLFGSNLGNANSHEPKDLPILVAGGGFSHGQHIVHEGRHNAPLCNLYVTLLQSMGVETDAFGQSTSTLTWA